MVENAVDIDAEQLPTAARQRIGDVVFTTEPVGHAPILLVAPDGRETRFPRAMCRYTTTDGRRRDRLDRIQLAARLAHVLTRSRCDGESRAPAAGTRVDSSK